MSLKGVSSAPSILFLLLLQQHLPGVIGYQGGVISIFSNPAGCNLSQILVALPDGNTFRSPFDGTPYKVSCTGSEGKAVLSSYKHMDPYYLPERYVLWVLTWNFSVADSMAGATPTALLIA